MSANPFASIAETIKAAHWMERAACSPLTAELFWPEPSGSSKNARAICSHCEVRRQCVQHAIDNDERGGIWGGKSWEERKKLQPERPDNECPKGHDLDAVGTRTNGYCLQCDRERRERYEERRRQGLVPPRKRDRKRRQVNPTNPEAHGLYRHNLGCRCLICCNANAEKQRKIRERKRMRRSLSIVKGGVA